MCPASFIVSVLCSGRSRACHIDRRQRAWNKPRHLVSLEYAIVGVLRTKDQG